MAFFFRRFAKRRHRGMSKRQHRALSLIEVMVSQVIGLIVITGIMALVVAMVRKLNSELSVADAQVHLRQATHLLLRDTQGVGGEVSISGDVVTVLDGGTAGADGFTIFKRDESVCGGLLTVAAKPAAPGAAPTTHDGVTINIADVDTNLTSGITNVCPFTLSVCPTSELAGRAVLMTGAARSVQMTGHTVNASSCKINFPGGQQSADLISSYNTRYGTNLNNISGVLDDIGPLAILVGSSFSYRLLATTLQRSTDNGLTFQDVLDNVFDLQVERVYLDDDEDTNLGLLNFVGSTGVALPAGYDEAEFLGLRIGIITFASARADLAVAPPASSSNRNLTSAPGGRRYRASDIFAASRNRTGV